MGQHAQGLQEEGECLVGNGSVQQGSAENDGAAGEMLHDRPSGAGKVSDDDAGEVRAFFDGIDKRLHLLRQGGVKGVCRACLKPSGGVAFLHKPIPCLWVDGIVLAVYMYRGMCHICKGFLSALDKDPHIWCKGSGIFAHTQVLDKS